MPDEMMADEVRHVVWLNRGNDPLAFLLHAMAPQARELMVEELGATHCAVSQTARSVAAPLTLLPEAAQWIDDADAPEPLDAALTVTLGGAASLRVLAAGDIVRADRWLRLAAAARPDILCLAPSVLARLPQPWSPGALRRVDPDGPLADLQLGPLRLFAQPPAMALLQDRLLRQEAHARRRAGQDAACYDVADLPALQGVRRSDRGIAWTGPQRRGVLLLPGHGGGDLRVELRLAATRLPLDADHLRFWVAGREAAATFDAEGRRVTLLARALMPELCHRLEIAHAELPHGPGEAPAGIALRAIAVERLA